MTTPHRKPRRIFIQQTASLLALGWLAPWRGAQADAAQARQGFAYIGTRTGDASRGIHVFATSGDRWTPVQVVSSENPTYLATHPAQRILYAINEIDTYQGLPSGSVEAYAIDPGSGRLSLIDRQPLSLSGTSPAHMAVSPDGRFLVIALYGGGAYNLVPIDANGRLLKVSGILKETGCGPDAKRQEAAHPHMVLFDPTGQRILASDLGSDRISVLTLADGELAVHGRIATTPGYGPRHIALHPAGRMLYVINELDATVDCHGYDATSGTILERRHRVSTLPDDFFGERNAAALVVHPSGRFLYATNRRVESDHSLADSIAVLRIDAASGALVREQFWSDGVRFPRALTLAPDGTHLYALNQKGDDILRLEIDPAKGRLQQPVRVAQAPAPTCLVFAA